jgi:hypothetical protein
LAYWKNTLGSVPGARDKVKQTLADWLNDRDLGCLRESAELEKIPAEERKDWQALWAEVTSLAMLD